MKSLSKHLTENFSKDIVIADKVIDALRKFITKVIKIRKNHSDDGHDIYFADVLTLTNSAIENIEFAISDAINESKEDDKLSLQLSDLITHADVILDSISALTKSKVLSIEILDAKVDVEDILNLLDDFKIEILSTKK